MTDALSLPVQHRLQTSSTLCCLTFFLQLYVKLAVHSCRLL